MNTAYSACDLLVARSGATTIAELLVLGIPSILDPSPNFAGNHQYNNAKSLMDNNAAIIVEDKNLEQELAEKIIETINNSLLLEQLGSNARRLGKPDAAETIAKSAINFAETI